MHAYIYIYIYTYIDTYIILGCRDVHIDRIVYDTTIML